MLKVFGRQRGEGHLQPVCEAAKSGFLLCFNVSCGLCPFAFARSCFGAGQVAGKKISCAFEDTLRLSHHTMNGLGDKAGVGARQDCIDGAA